MVMVVRFTYGDVRVLIPKNNQNMRLTTNLIELSLKSSHFVEYESWADTPRTEFSRSASTSTQDWKSHSVCRSSVYTAKRMWSRPRTGEVTGRIHAH
ncbi:hypothetical protein NPIL_521021 [Nephila pilipes]|uniref:Uncharacterized protein n=1 Tax=Nephila pilipes TaxID=299642 RepID=A0A8X6NGN9_NEPPI|nr:hypothetical protein NPIL_521021 [Nephila pilipes]